MTRRIRTLAAAALALGTVSLVTVDVAEARRGGSFGSRGMRTNQAAPPTRTAPEQAPPVQRSMTPQQPGAAQAARQPAMRPGASRAMPRGGIFSNPLVRGLLLGGLIGALLGFGFGGLGGGMAMILQIAVLALVAFMLFRLFAGRRREQTAAAGGAGLRSGFEMQPPASPAEPNRYFPAATGAMGQASPAYDTAAEPSDDIGVTQEDFDAFERLLKEIQGAFGAEDYAALRSRTTPEIMSYLAEELSQNATQGLRNEVTDVTLDQGDLAEAWSEDGADYATVAMKYSSRDVMRDRATGDIRQGDPDRATQATELWTFVRQRGLPWKLSAIQET